MSLVFTIIFCKIIFISLFVILIFLCLLFPLWSYWWHLIYFSFGLHVEIIFIFYFLNKNKISYKFLILSWALPAIFSNLPILLFLNFIEELSHFQLWFMSFFSSFHYFIISFCSFLSVLWEYLCGMSLLSIRISFNSTILFCCSSSVFIPVNGTCIFSYSCQNPGSHS